VIGVAALAATALALAACPHDPSLGALRYDRGGLTHELSLADCRDRVVGKATPFRWPTALRSPQDEVALIRVTKPRAGIGAETIVIDRRPVYRVRENYRRNPGGDPGPLQLLFWSPDSRWLFFVLDPFNSASLAADGLQLRALHVSDGRVVPVATTLVSPDYWSWCGSTLVLAAGGNRIATATKRLAVARAPDWRPRPLWPDRSRAFGSLACAPDGRSVAVLSQPARDTGDFFATRWQLWRVGLDGSRRLLDRPPPGWADESPRWSPDGRALAFVRERRGRGVVWLWRGGRLYGPLASLGFSLGYYGHRDWPLSWRR
jgi:hypothetical protein